MRLEIISEKPVSASRPVPVLFVHGMWLSAWCWSEHFLPYFARHGYEAYALSLRGHGGSEGVRSIRRVSLKDYLSDVEYAVERIGCQPVLVGHSMGGLLVQKYLELHQPAAAILLASAPPAGLLGATLRIFRRQPLAATMVNLTMSMRPVVATPFLLKELVMPADMPDAMVSACFSRLNEDSYRAYLEMLWPKLKKRAGQEVPMLVLGGENDMIMSERDLRETGRRFGVEAEIFPGMAHCMMLEPGWQSVADRIIGWLEQQGI
jgi:pimeloyl-ACP methyl ester carboxylesterase